jgi:hypothetical protein
MIDSLEGLPMLPDPDGAMLAKAIGAAKNMVITHMEKHRCSFEDARKSGLRVLSDPSINIAYYNDNDYDMDAITYANTCRVMAVKWMKEHKRMEDYIDDE